MSSIRSIHKWIAITLGLQLFLWMLSGLVMGLLPHDLVRGDHFRRLAPPVTSISWTSKMVDRTSLQIGSPPEASIESISLATFDGHTVYRVVTTEGVHLEDAGTGLVISIDELLARKLAAADYSGPGAIAAVQRLDEVTLAIRRRQAPVWKVDYDDRENTSLYISARDGAVLERRNTYWRIFDFVWMLHIMDYTGRSNFNNVLVITTALILLWLGATGLILWWDSFRREDFALVSNFRKRNLRHKFKILENEGSENKTVYMRSTITLFQGLAAEGYALPSSCGGGGNCGLCRVRISSGVKISPADRRQIPDIELQQGYRLACQHRIDADATITLPHGLLNSPTFYATVARTRFVTPYICEIRLALSGKVTLDFRAGSYLQIEVPVFESSLDQLPIPEVVRNFWLESGVPVQFGTDEIVRRAYSIANAPSEMNGELLLNVRLALPNPDIPGVPVGIGSAYLAGLRAGDSVSLRGPFGDFAIREDSDDMIFVGGGAGMAPLRSMIVDQLKMRGSTNRMSFWYGARTTSDTLYKEEMESLADRHNHFSFHVALSDVQDDETWNGMTGFISQVLKERLLDSHPDLGRCSFYVCGPTAMLCAVKEALDEMGVSPNRIAFDDFGI